MPRRVAVLLGATTVAVFAAVAAVFLGEGRWMIGSVVAGLTGLRGLRLWQQIVDLREGDGPSVRPPGPH
jgi:hypothetical protein